MLLVSIQIIPKELYKEFNSNHPGQNHLCIIIVMIAFIIAFWGIIIRPNRVALLYLAAYMEQTDASLHSQW